MNSVTDSLYCLYGDQYINPIEPAFPLQRFPDFIRCYIFLCRVADDIANQVGDEFKRWGTETGKVELKEKNRNVSLGGTGKVTSVGRQGCGRGEKQSDSSPSGL